LIPYWLTLVSRPTSPEDHLSSFCRKMALFTAEAEFFSANRQKLATGTGLRSAPEGHFWSEFGPSVRSRDCDRDEQKEYVCLRDEQISGQRYEVIAACEKQDAIGRTKWFKSLCWQLSPQRSFPADFISIAVSIVLFLFLAISSGGSYPRVCVCGESVCSSTRQSS